MSIHRKTNYEIVCNTCNNYSFTGSLKVLPTTWEIYPKKNLAFCCPACKFKFLNQLPNNKRLEIVEAIEMAGGVV